MFMFQILGIKYPNKIYVIHILFCNLVSPPIQVATFLLKLKNQTTIDGVKIYDTNCLWLKTMSIAKKIKLKIQPS